MAFGRKQFEIWLRKQLGSDRDEGRCTKLVLQHVTSGKKAGGEVVAISIPKKIRDQEAVESLLTDTTTEIENASNADAAGIGGTQSYVISAWFENSERPLARFTFRVMGSDEDDGDLSSEAPTKEGLLGQLMRHNDVMMRTSVMSTGQTIAMLQRQNSRLQETLESLLEEKWKNLEVMEGLYSQKQERELAASNAAMKQKLLGEFAEKAQLLFPVIVNKLAGRKALPEPEGGSMMAMMKGFLETLTPDQFEVLGKVLRPEQQIAVAELMSQYQVNDEAENKKKAAKEAAIVTTKAG